MLKGRCTSKTETWKAPSVLQPTVWEIPSCCCFITDCNLPVSESIELSPTQAFPGLPTLPVAFGETDSGNVQLPLRDIRCVEWAWGNSLQINAAHGDFSLFGIGEPVSGSASIRLMVRPALRCCSELIQRCILRKPMVETTVSDSLSRLPIKRTIVYNLNSRCAGQ